MLHWAQLPVAIWNDRYYDNAAIFTGSTTIVNGKPVMMYP
jgi:sucrose-6-phosphate hydrolase SacC (GH32 family)